MQPFQYIRAHNFNFIKHHKNSPVLESPRYEGLFCGAEQVIHVVIVVIVIVIVMCIISISNLGARPIFELS